MEKLIKPVGSACDFQDNRRFCWPPSQSEHDPARVEGLINTKQ